MVSYYYLWQHSSSNWHLANEVPVVPVTATTTPFNLNSIVDKSTGVTVEDDISGL